MTRLLILCCCAMTAQAIKEFREIALGFCKAGRVCSETDIRTIGKINETIRLYQDEQIHELVAKNNKMPVFQSGSADACSLRTRIRYTGDTPLEAQQRLVRDGRQLTQFLITRYYYMSYDSQDKVVVKCKTPEPLPLDNGHSAWHEFTPLTEQAPLLRDQGHFAVVALPSSHDGLSATLVGKSAVLHMVQKIQEDLDGQVPLAPRCTKIPQTLRYLLSISQQKTLDDLTEKVNAEFEGDDAVASRPASSGGRPSIRSKPSQAAACAAKKKAAKNDNKGKKSKKKDADDASSDDDEENEYVTSLFRN
jgi:hypothetical protein